MGDSPSVRQSLDDSSAVQLTGKIMMIAVLVLFLVVVFVLCLHLYAKWYWWRTDGANPSTDGNQSGRRRRRRFVFAPGQDPVATMRKGLDPLVLRSLPVVIFPSDDFKDGLECAVCLSELVQGEKARLLPKCNHGFHVDCIDMWFQSHSTCPLCRNPVAPETSVDSGSSALAESNGGVDNDVEIQSLAENLVSGFSIEAPNFPTNVLFWGNQTQVSSGSGSGLEEGPSSQPICPPSSSRPDGMLVIDIPSDTSFALPSPSPSPSANRFAAEEDLKSPATTRLRSLKRLLSRDRRLSVCSPGSVDAEQGGRGGQS